MKAMLLECPYILLLSYISAPEAFIVSLKGDSNKMLEIDDNLNKTFDVIKFEVITKGITCLPCE